MSGTANDVEPIDPLIAFHAMETALNANAIAGMDGKVIYGNAALLSMWGYTSLAEVLGRDVRDFWDVDGDLGILAAIRETGAWRGELVGLRPDGSTFDVQVAASLVRDASGKPVAMLASFLDLTAMNRMREHLVESLRQAELAREELDRQNRLHRLILDSLPIGVAVSALRPDAGFEYCNATFRRMYRIGADVIWPRDFWEAAFPDPVFRESIRDRVEAAVATGDQALMQWKDVPLVRPGETTTYVSSSNATLAELGLLVSTVIDTTDRKRDQDDLRAANARLEALWSVSSLADADFSTISARVLEHLARMTGCEYGFYGLVDPQGDGLEVSAFSATVDPDCHFPIRPTRFPLEGAGLWAEAIRTGRPVLVNDYRLPHPGKRGLPTGHVPIRNLLVVPHAVNGRLVALAAVANRDEPFGDADILQIDSFLSGIQSLTEAKAAAAALKASEEQYRLLFENSLIGIAHGALAGGPVGLNPALARLLGYPENGAAGVNPALHFDRHADFVTLARELRITGAVAPREIRLRRANGRGFWALVSAGTSQTDASGKAQRFAAWCVDISARKAAEADLTSALDSNRVLLRELYHRTKNNLNVINSIIELQRLGFPDPAVNSLLRDLQGRISAMALVHQMLYRSSDLSRLEFGAYVQELATQVAACFEDGRRRPRVDFELEPIHLLVDTAMPCGLILNELLTNSFKHAFTATTEPLIRIGARVDPSGTVTVEYRDNGSGYGPHGPDETSALGLACVRRLVEHQLQGAVVFSDQGGAVCRFSFTGKHYKERI